MFYCKVSNKLIHLYRDLFWEIAYLVNVIYIINPKHYGNLGHRSQYRPYGGTGSYT